MKHVLTIFLDLLAQHWLLLLVASVLGGLLLLVILRALLRRWRGHRVPQTETHETHEPSTAVQTRTARGSLMRLARTHYTVLDEIYVPRFEGEGCTRIDHIVLSTHGIFVIHVQHERGIITSDTAQRHWRCEHGPEEKTLTNPIPRSSYHVRALARFLGLPEALFFPIIYFENPVTFTSELPAYVITSGLGRHIISHKAEVLSPELLTNVSSRLQAHQVEQTLDSARLDYAAARGRRLREVRDTIAALITSMALT